MWRDVRRFLLVIVVVPFMYLFSAWLSVTFDVSQTVVHVWNIQAILLGIVTKIMSACKGYPTGFHWGYFLSVAGVVIVARRPEHAQFEQWCLQKQQAKVEHCAARTEKRAKRDTFGKSRYYSVKARAIAIAVLILLVIVAAAPGIVGSFQEPEVEPLKVVGMMLLMFAALVVMGAIASYVLSVALSLCCYLGNSVCNVIMLGEKDSTEERINILQLFPTSAAILYIGLLAFLVKSNWPCWWDWLTHLFA